MYHKVQVPRAWHRECGTVALARGDCRTWQTYKSATGRDIPAKMREIILISQSAIAVGAVSVWIACALPDCLEAFDACCDLYNLYPDSSSTIPRPARNPRRGPTRAVVAAAVFASSLRIFGPYLSLLALVLFLLCYFSGSVAPVVPRARPRFTRMLLSHSSRKQLLLKGTGASSRASLAIANRTSALLRSVKSHGNGFKRGFRKAAYYSTSARPDNQTGGAGLGGKPEWGPGLPLYRQSCCFSAGCGPC